MKFGDPAFQISPTFTAVRSGSCSTTQPVVQGIQVSEGVYYASTGPTYESPAEIKAL